MATRDSPRPIVGQLLLAVFLSTVALVAAGPRQDTASGEVLLVPAFQELSFEKPVFLTHAGDGSGRVFVVEQRGVVWSVDLASERSTRFLDISDRVNRGGNEEGLLGLAFSPDFASTGHLFVYYSAASPRRSVLSRFTVGPAGTPAIDSELVILEVAQPFSNHNGGMIAFGPDGLLYVGLGDGGSGGDPQGNGQDRATLLGSLLRIDVSEASAGEPYRVPADNPFAAASGARGEIWAYGLRNPWRFSFDSDTGDLWLGDVGQNAYEEIDLIIKGGNYGWNTTEGFHCFGADACVQGGFELPIVEYGHDLGCSVTGGYVYRGAAVPELDGAYIYADFCSGRVWTLRYDDGVMNGPELIADADFPISSFGTDERDELYVLGFDGRVYRFRSQSPSPAPTATPIQPATATPIRPATATPTPTQPAIATPSSPTPAATATPTASLPTPTSGPMPTRSQPTVAPVVPTSTPVSNGGRLSSGVAIALAVAFVVAGGGTIAGLRWLRRRREQS